MLTIKTKQTEEMERILQKYFPNDEIAQKFIDRIKAGKLTKDENPKSHLCAYFAAYDQEANYLSS